MAKIITISRQYGSGGHSVAIKLSEKLGIPYYDQDIINELSAKTGYSQEMIKSQGEHMESDNFLLNALKTSRFETNKQDQIWKATKSVIRDLAEKESCIIVGRCANYILRNNPDVISVFLTADYDTCAAVIKERTGSAETPTPKDLAKIDKRRAAFYHYYTDEEWSDARNYTLALNTGKLGIDKCADIIAALYNA